MMAMSLRFNSSDVAATDRATPFRSSPTTLISEVDSPSEIRTTPTLAPFADNPSARAALNVASPHAVGG
jgi:hypothetical protein